MNIPETNSPNGPAYTHTETRTGPPLDYVAEKLKYSLVSIHTLYALAMRDLPDDLPCPESIFLTWPEYNPKIQSVIQPCFDAFRNGVKSYLALVNLLEIGNQDRIFERLLQMPRDEFSKWINSIESEGSVT